MKGNSEGKLNPREYFGIHRLFFVQFKSKVNWAPVCRKEKLIGMSILVFLNAKLLPSIIPLDVLFLWESNKWLEK